MNIVKDCLEIVYYVAFIILTYLIVMYAKKTYRLQSERSFLLLCKINVQESTFGDYDYRYMLEIYNYGNDVARQISVIVSGKHISTVDFIKPNESYMFPLGTVGQMIGCNRVWPDNGDELNEGDTIHVQLIVEGKSYEFNVNTDLLFSCKGTYTGTLKEVSSQIDDVCKAIKQECGEISTQVKRVSSGIDEISKRIK